MVCKVLQRILNGSTGSLPEGTRRALEPWTGDLPDMAERRVVRLLTVHEPMFFGFDGRRQSGLIAEAAVALEEFLNQRLERNQLKVKLSRYWSQWVELV